MSKIYIICEGQTEKLFVDRLLAPYVLEKNSNCFLYPILIGTNNHKGGDVRFTRFLMTFKNVRTPNCYISSLLDYFRIDSDWPGQDIIRESLKRGVSLYID